MNTPIDKLFFNHATTPGRELSQMELDAMITALDAQARVNGISSIVVDFDNHELLYKTDSLIYIDEISINDVKRPCTNPYWSLISDDTLSFLLSIRRAFELLDGMLCKKEYAHHVCTIDYPIILRGREIYINQKFTPIYLRPDGITKIGLYSFSNSSKNRLDSMVIMPSGKRFRFDQARKTFEEFDLGFVLTAVEKAVMQRAKKGMSSEEIATDLNISVNTIKTHRTRIFKKLNVTSINEALTLISNYQLM